MIFVVIDQFKELQMMEQYVNYLIVIKNEDAKRSNNFIILREQMAQKQGLHKQNEYLFQQPSTNAHNKAINSMREVTQIRKVTQETLSPVIKKIQQNISHLLSQSAALRKSSLMIQQIQSMNLEYKLEIQSMKTKISEMRNQIIEMNQQIGVNKSDNTKSFIILEGLVEGIQRQGSDTKDQIKRLTNMNKTQNQLFNNTKINIQQTVGTLKQDIKQFYQNTIKASHKSEQNYKNVQQQLQTQKRTIQHLTQQLQSVKSLTSIYSSQRKEIRNFIEQFIDLKHHAVLRDDYEKDMKFFRIDNQLTKSYVQKILDEALTPEIRSFLPSLISNIELLRKIQKEIKNLEEEIVVSREAEKALQQKLLKVDYSSKKAVEEKSVELKRLIMHLESQTSTITQKLENQCQFTQQKLHQVQSILNRHKEESDHMFETFIEQNRTKIYLAVLQCKPPEVKEEEERIRAKLVKFQDQMQQIMKLNADRTQSIVNLGKSIESRLEIFQNRITKAKTDIKMENDNIKKTIEGLNAKLQQSQNKIHEQSQIISKLLEVSIINTCLHIEDQYLHLPGRYSEQNNQTYISFYDGVIYEASVDIKKDETIYRKKKINKQIFKRALLNQQTKLIDSITQKLKSWKWHDPKERPSHYFVQNIFPAYETMMAEKKHIIEGRNNQQRRSSNSNLRTPSPEMVSQKKIKQRLVPRSLTTKVQKSIQKKNSFSKSIQEKSDDITSVDLTKGISLVEKMSIEVNNQPQSFTMMEFTKPNRIRLKKLDQKESKEFDQFTIRKERYNSVNKKTIQ